MKYYEMGIIQNNTDLPSSLTRRFSTFLPYISYYWKPRLDPFTTADYTTGFTKDTIYIVHVDDYLGTNPIRLVVNLP